MSCFGVQPAISGFHSLIHPHSFHSLIYKKINLWRKFRPMKHPKKSKKTYLQIFKCTRVGLVFIQKFLCPDSYMCLQFLYIYGVIQFEGAGEQFLELVQFIQSEESDKMVLIGEHTTPSTCRHSGKHVLCYRYVN